jgi:hypothetical protein
MILVGIGIAFGGTWLIQDSQPQLRRKEKLPPLPINLFFLPQIVWHNFQYETELTVGHFLFVTISKALITPTEIQLVGVSCIMS